MFFSCTYYQQQNRFVCMYICLSAALKVTLPILLSKHMTSEVDANGIAVEVEPSSQYHITCCYHVTDSSRGAVWQMVPDMEVPMKQKRGTELLNAEKNCTHRHSAMLAECLWRSNSECEHSEASLLPDFLWVRQAGSCSSLEKYIANVVNNVEHEFFCSWEFALSNSVITLFVFVVVSMEINRRHYFWSDLHNICTELMY